MDQIRDYSQFASSLKSERQNSSLFVGFTVEIWSTQLSFPVLKLFHFDFHFVSFLSLLVSQCLVSYCKLINFTNFFFFFCTEKALAFIIIIIRLAFIIIIVNSSLISK